MKKMQLIESLKKIKIYHDFQTLKVKDLVHEKEVFDLTPLDENKCQFGQWLNDPNNNLKILLGSIFYNDLVKKHENWHRKYKNICNLFFLDGNIEGTPKKLTPKEKEICKYNYEQITIIEDQIAKMLKSCERRLHALSDDKF